MDFKTYIILIFINFKLVSCHYHKVNGTIADRLAEVVTVLCAVVLSVNDTRKQKEIISTWGQRCNTLIFICPNETNVTRVPTIIGVIYYNFQIVKQKLSSDYKWYLVVDEEGFVVVENLRYMLADFDPDDNFYFINQNVDDRTASKFILFSQNAFITFSEANVESKCENFTSNIATCFDLVGLVAANSLDPWFRDRIIPLDPYKHQPNPGHEKFWFCNRKKYDETYGCYSNYAVFFLGVKYIITDFLVYMLKPYGITYHFDTPIILQGGKPPITVKQDTEVTEHSNENYDNEDDDLMESTIYLSIERK